jgi:hypothetical protein
MRNLRLLFAISGLALVLGSGCGNDDLPDYFLLDRLRVLGANTTVAAAEFSAGTAGIQVAFHVSDPTGAGRTLNYSLEACIDPGIGLGATPSCNGNPTRTVITASSTFVPGSAATNYYGVLTTPAFSIPSAGTMFIDPRTGSSRPSYEQANGVGYLVFLTLTASSTESVTAFKRIIVSTKATKNQNPVFGTPSLLFAGVDAAAYTLTTTPFTAVAQATTGSTESYSVTQTDGSLESKTEKLTVTWLVSTGEIRFTRTDPGFENRYTPVSPLPAKTSIIAVLRDDRGGSAIVTFDKP